MAGFTGTALEKKLTELNNTQQSIQTLSLWLIHHRKHCGKIVQVWLKELKKASPNRKLTFMYLANDVIQNSKKKGPEFHKEFSSVLNKAFGHVHEHVSDSKTKSALERLVKIWEERKVYDNAVISGIQAALRSRSKSPGKSPNRKEVKKVEVKAEKSKKRKSKHLDIEQVIKKKATIFKEESILSLSPRGEPPEPETLIKALLDLDVCPSTDAVVREKIARLPPEVSDVSLLEKIKTREAADKLETQVNEASALLTDYNARLNLEMEDRKKVTKMIKDFTHHQREQVALAEKKMEEYVELKKRVAHVRNELKSHLQNLPDLTLLPSVTGGLAPLPSAGDLFQ